jgi:hypothetical protein
MAGIYTNPKTEIIYGCDKGDESLWVTEHFGTLAGRSL